MSAEERPFRDLRVPEPPDDLRRGVLGRARAALKRGQRPDLWTRLWESRRARLIWAASTFALVLCHLLVPAGGAGPAKEPSTSALAAREESEDLDAITDLPRISLEALPVIASTSAPGEGEADATAADSEENES